ncbi:MAG TPA: peptidoglycan DD-metalloendopeptidase family protein [Candidatus Avipropionibacterium avicola]|uniref:Peptidoglycan DD-metalloendopeptidase family protein n=1 Tax=Candidatus Avipropionibacterium avicola TaxID=2840701 RepID=A0A9D1GWW2_9ACTN|nr:peptidoglycan DD-metalloendopeptidase family protein [Candidatus Avipropionibacterium avicola]
MAIAVALAAAVSVGLTVPTTAHADDLDDQKSRIQKQLDKTKKELNESSKDLNKKVAALEASRIRLADARDKLAQVQADLAKARERDRKLAVRLAEEQEALEKAKKEVAAGIKRLEAQRAKVGEVVQQQWQQRTNLLPVAVLATAGSTRDFQTRLQWSSTMFDAAEAKIKELEKIQQELNAKRQKQSEIEREVAKRRAQAAENLETQKRLEAEAQSVAAQVASLVAANKKAQSDAKKAVAEDESRYAELESERAAVEKRIKARIAAEKAAEAKRQAELAKQKASRNKNKGGSSGGGGGGGGGSAPGGGNSGGGGGGGGGTGFIYPVNGPITSPYGMRLHPVTGVYKLHDGTDFGVGCGTPIKAAASGRVTERYFHAAWGNRLMIDHGKVNGRYISTAYNHATHYVVGVGQHVSQGQVIGYVGTTGYSTGCHLHLNLYVNGSVTNPMGYL